MKVLETILLVDDSMSTNLLNKELLLSMDLAKHIEMASNGKEALDYIRSEGEYKDAQEKYPKPDLILLDINMPLMNGLEFLEEYDKIDAKYRGKEGVVISMLTQKFDPKEYDQTRDKLGAKDYLVKPLNKEDLLEMWDKFMY